MDLDLRAIDAKIEKSTAGVSSQSIFAPKAALEVDDESVDWEKRPSSFSNWMFDV